MSNWARDSLTSLLQHGPLALPGYTEMSLIVERGTSTAIRSNDPMQG